MNDPDDASGTSAGEIGERADPRVMACGHLDLGDSWHGGRPVQCLCQWEGR